MNAQDDSGLIETEISSRRLDISRYFTWVSSRVRLPDGKESTREYLMHPGAVMILPVLSDGRLLFERQFRYPLRQVFYELPAGKLHPGEDKLLCAQRELKEETGYVGATWRYLGKVSPAIGYSDEVIEIFLAENLSFEAQALDEGEFIETLSLSLSEAVQYVLEGKITDAKTVAGIFWAQQLADGLKG